MSELDLSKHCEETIARKGPLDWLGANSKDKLASLAEWILCGRKCPQPVSGGSTRWNKQLSDDPANYYYE